mmetsp:Transcript_14789/g.10694  ORF Transcript_14789/g.10694 Transcript_14789/m.10694 type:complete len:94 (-) Transcript_14789:1041-1322(-)
MNQSGENDVHLISFIDDYHNKEAMNKLKNFRKFNTKNTDKCFHLKYWITEDRELAEKLKIPTDKVGDVYMLRQTSIFNKQMKNVKVAGFDFHS